MSATSSSERGLTRRHVLMGGLAAGMAGAVLAACSSAGDTGSQGVPISGPTTPVSRREVIAYGHRRTQEAELFRPEAPGPWPTVILIHGGFWGAGYTRDLMTYLASDLVERGWAAWNIDYRGIGDTGGAWPGTFEDVAAAVDTLADQPSIDLDRVVTVGHSAGGHLSLWVASRPGLPAGTTGAEPRVHVRAAVSQAGVVDLIGAAEEHLGDNAAGRLLGGTPAEVPDRYELASPAERVPIGVPLLLVHGEQDDIVPISQSQTMKDRAKAAGDDVHLVKIEGAGHFEHLDPEEETWPPVIDFLTAQFS